MKTSKWSVRMVGSILLVSCLGFFVVCRSIKRYLQRMPHLEVVCDSQLAPCAVEKLTAWCKQHPEVSFEPQKLVEEFSWVKSCTVRYSRIGHAMVRIEPHQALAVLNNDHVLVSNASVVCAEYYVDKPVVAFKVHDRVFTDRIQRKALVHSAQMMAPHLFENYAFSWCDATQCIVADKVTGHTVVADNQTVINSKKIDKGMELASSKCNADIRFDEQIILVKKRGGDEIISRC
ncbi:MAG: hypothetical protein AB7F19_02870 [Candidatus Babeliales bacterium]